MSDVTDTAPIDAEIVQDDGIEEAAATAGALDVRAAVGGMNDRDSDSFSTFTATTGAEKLKLLKSISASTPIDEAINTTFDLDNFMIQVVEITDSNTGELILAPRATLFDTEGKAYHGTSKGLLTSLRNLNTTLGERKDWDGPVKVKVVYGGKAPRRYYTLDFV